MREETGYYVSASITSRILSFRHDCPLILPGTKYVPGIGVIMTADTCKVPLCPGGCLYCFCALSTRKKHTESVRLTLSDASMKLVIRAIEIVKPDAITTAEKVELGFFPNAVKELQTLRAGIDKNIWMIFTTKFPEVWERLDAPNNAMLVTLSNPRQIAGLEPHIKPCIERAHGAYKAATTAKHLKVGVRALIMAREDIEPLRKMIAVLKPYLDPNLIWVDFLREPFVAKGGGLLEAIRNHLDASQFIHYENHGKSLRKEIMIDAVKALTPYGATFDRLPINLRKNQLDPNMKMIDVRDKTKCYVRADGTECVRGASSWQSHYCTGRIPEEGCGGQGIVKWAQVGNFCMNLTHMTPAQYKKIHDLWHWIEDVKAFAFGRKSKSGNKIYWRVIQTLHDPELLARIFK